MKDSEKNVVEEDRLMEVWRTHHDKTSYEEFTWERIGFDRCKSSVRA